MLLALGSGQLTLMATYSQRVKQRQKQQEFLPHISISKPW